MIKFFKKIRKNLIKKKKKNRKYIKYALGEVMLVVIGILIALSLNNWKENLANLGEEKRILSGLKQEFEFNIEEISRNIKLNTATKGATVDLIHLIRTENAFENSRYLDSLLNAVYMYGTFDAQTGIIDEVISSGKLSIIKDRELQDRLTSFSGLLNNLEGDYRVRSNYYNDHIIPYLSKYISLANQNQYLDFSSWSDTYKTTKLSVSPFKPIYKEINLLQFENLIVMHKLNNDFVNLDESDLKEFFIKTLEIINNNLESDK